jgi:hypothetical protein
LGALRAPNRGAFVRQTALLAAFFSHDRYLGNCAFIVCPSIIEQCSPQGPAWRSQVKRSVAGEGMPKSYCANLGKRVIEAGRVVEVSTRRSGALRDRGQHSRQRLAALV